MLKHFMEAIVEESEQVEELTHYFWSTSVEADRDFSRKNSDFYTFLCRLESTLVRFLCCPKWGLIRLLRNLTSRSAKKCVFLDTCVWLTVHKLFMTMARGRCEEYPVPALSQFVRVRMPFVLCRSDSRFLVHVLSRKIHRTKCNGREECS